MITVVQKGILPSEIPMTGTCGYCSTIIECVYSDCSQTFSFSKLYVNCPTCTKRIYVDYIKEKLFGDDPIVPRNESKLCIISNNIAKTIKDVWEVDEKRLYIKKGEFGTVIHVDKDVVAIDFNHKFGILKFQRNQCIFE